LGEDFIRQADAAIRSLATTALYHSIRFSDVRRAPLKRFHQYGAFYFIDGDAVIVFAVFHGARHPRWLRERRNAIS
jgi:plasmid stabilization system protein ParE